eukprot:5853531-Pyramimonas_sp.AAC.1
MTMITGGLLHVECAPEPCHREANPQSSAERAMVPHHALGGAASRNASNEKSIYVWALHSPMLLHVAAIQSGRLRVVLHKKDVRQLAELLQKCGHCGEVLVILNGCVFGAHQAGKAVQ